MNATSTVRLNDLQLDLVTAVRQHAEAHYNEAGWDYVVETMTDEDIAALIGRSWTVDGALRKVAATAFILDERRAEIVAEAF